MFNPVLTVPPKRRTKEESLINRVKFLGVAFVLFLVSLFVASVPMNSRASNTMSQGFRAFCKDSSHPIGGWSATCWSSFQQAKQTADSHKRDTNHTDVGVDNCNLD